MSDFEGAYLKFLHDKPRTFKDRSLFSLLKFLSFFFLTGWWIKKTTYRSGVRIRKRLTCPVVSIGNITTGGTGKKHLVVDIPGSTLFFPTRGKVAVLSRGYRRTLKKF